VDSCDGLVETTARAKAPSERQLFGVVIAQVIANDDQTQLGRVQLRLPWLPGVEPWARVASPMAGANCGIFFAPQPGDEVLVAFENGDLADPFVLGGLWNGVDRPPQPVDPVNRRAVRTPAGHELVFDDKARSISITSADGHTVQIAPDRISIAFAATADAESGEQKSPASIVLERSGRIVLDASAAIELKAPSIKLKGKILKLKGTESAILDGGLNCVVKANDVAIN
jgi:uncharacterized protein involved in type VI secretion and phage assembly